jgi:hypothetical protein
MARDIALQSDPSLPPGCRAADLDRGSNPIEELSPAELWRLLDDRRRAAVYRDFFHREWAELSACLEDHPDSAAARSGVPSLGDCVRALWIGWRNSAVRRMALAGEIQLPQE